LYQRTPEGGPAGRLLGFLVLFASGVLLQLYPWHSFSRDYTGDWLFDHLCWLHVMQTHTETALPAARPARSSEVAQCVILQKFDTMNLQEAKALLQELTH